LEYLLPSSDRIIKKEVSKMKEKLEIIIVVSPTGEGDLQFEARASIKMEKPNIEQLINSTWLPYMVKRLKAELMVATFGEDSEANIVNDSAAGEGREELTIRISAEISKNGTWNFPASITGSMRQNNTEIVLDSNLLDDAIKQSKKRILRYISN
jgi:hypothetical protein